MHRARVVLGAPQNFETNLFFERPKHSSIEVTQGVLNCLKYVAVSVFVLFCFFDQSGPRSIGKELP